MGNFRIRMAEGRDTHSIYYLIRSSIGQGDFLLPREEAEIGELIGRGNFFVAVEGGAAGEGKVAGCASLEEYGGIAELRSLVVEENWRRQGIGKELVRSVESLAGRRKYGRLYTLVDQDLVEFYEVQGFKGMGRFIGPDGGALDINGETLEKMKRYCMGCDRYKVCTEHLMCKNLNAEK